MKCVVFLFGLLALVSADTDTYSIENDDLDIEAVVSKKEAHQAFIDCFLDKGPCDEVQADFKKDLPEAVEQACAKCTDAQKHIFQRFLAATKEKLPKEYAAMRGKYDPKGTLFSALETAIANY